MDANTQSVSSDVHEQLRTLYKSVLEDQNRFDEFKQLLAAYPLTSDGAVESEAATQVRENLNARVRAWIGPSFRGLSSTQVSLWRAIIVDERINVAISPWKESNAY